MNTRKRKRTEATIDGDADLKSKPVTQRSWTMGSKNLKQTGDKSVNMLGNNLIEDVRWLCSLSESEIDLLICLKMLVLRRAKKMQPSLSNNFNLKVLRDLSFAMMENLKDELKDVSLGPDFAELLKLIAESNLSQVHAKESFSWMTLEELWPFICPDKERKKKSDI